MVTILMVEHNIISNALDYTLLDPHLGTLMEWRSAIEEIHRRGFYVIIDLTITTLGDLLAFEG